jgi:hypothetical protein
MSFYWSLFSYYSTTVLFHFLYFPNVSFIPHLKKSDGHKNGKNRKLMDGSERWEG